ncbi:LysR family transcriptional regulator [Corynebacterium glutamicum]|uniref:LysR family transcriptional regulator n=1 Tax=Corynebacterium glutamicum TaxID=1718 RepID=UPI0009452A4F|nr:LysR family transcriptional regulator [Corynebacterium glutamicum]OKX84837.1 LysR family transcriptional regulator [Corynebacterium glutamicum]
MEIRWLEGFIAVAEELHFSNAAIRLGMAQSPLSQLIRKLEAELGQKLFDRSTRSVELTAAGKAFLPHAREIVASTAVAREAVNAAEGEIVGVVRVGFSGVLNYSTLPLLTSEVRKRLPNVELELVGQKLTKEAVSLLRLGALDITLMGLPIEDPEIETQLISVEGFCVVLPKNHRLAGEDVVDLADLSDEGFVTTPEFPGSVFRNSTFQLCAEAGFVPRISQQVNDPYMALLLVEVGVGVAVTTQSTGKLAPANTVTLPIKQCSVELRHGVAWMQGAGRVARDAVIDIALEIFNP